MIDVETKQPLVVDPGNIAGPSMEVSMTQLPAVKAVLDQHPVIYWTSAGAISEDDGPYFLRVEFGQREVADKIQAILDSVA